MSTEYPAEEIHHVSVEYIHVPVDDGDIFVDFSFIQTNILPPLTIRQVYFHHDTTNEIVRRERARHDISRPPKFKTIVLYLILLDIESRVCIFNDSSFVMNIHSQIAGRFIEVHTNSGTQKYFFVGNTQYFGEVWYNPDSIVSILSLGKVNTMYRITMESSVSHTMHIRLPGGIIMTFHEIPNILYCHDTRSHSVKISDQVTDYSFVNIVGANKNLYTTRQVKGADKTVPFNNLVGYLRPQRLIQLLEQDCFQTCPITDEDAKRALDIHVPDTDYLKGNTTRVTPQHVAVPIIISLSNTIRDRHKNVTLCSDFYFVQSTSFLQMIAQDLILRITRQVKNRSKRTMIEGLHRTL